MVTIKCHLKTVSLPTSFSSFTSVELELDEIFIIQNDTEFILEIDYDDKKRYS